MAQREDKEMKERKMKEKREERETQKNYLKSKLLKRNGGDVTTTE